MNKFSLFFKIFIRYLKEKNMYHLAKPYISDEILSIGKENQVLDRILDWIGINIFFTSKERLPSNLINFFCNDYNNKEFNSLLTVFCKNEIKKFITREDHKNILLEGLYMKNFQRNMDNGISSSNHNKLLEIAINEMIDAHKSPFLLILNSFRFQYNDVLFWLNKSKEYEKFIWHYLNKQL